MPSTLMDDVRTVIDAMADPLRTEAEYARAAVRLLDMCDAYDALAPDWSDAPEWAMWYAVDADGDAWWFRAEPEHSGYTEWSVDHHVSEWRNVKEKFYFEIANLTKDPGDLPLGIDFRLCKWQRPEENHA